MTNLIELIKDPNIPVPKLNGELEGLIEKQGSLEYFHIPDMVHYAIPAAAQITNRLLEISKGGSAIGLVSNVLLGLGNTAEILIARTIIQAVVWGGGRLATEAYHQISNPENANFANNCQQSMNKLGDLEEKYLWNNKEVSLATFALLKKLEQEIIAEGQKTSPDLSLMEKDILKAQLIRSAICAGNLVEQDKIKEIVEQSSEVIKNFYNWETIQKERGFSNTATTASGVILTLMVGGLEDPRLRRDLGLWGFNFTGLSNTLSAAINSGTKELK